MPECIIGYYLPTVAHSQLGYVQHVINVAMGHCQYGPGLFIVMGMATRLVVCCSPLPRGGPGRWASLLLATGTGHRSRELIGSPAARPTRGRRVDGLGLPALVAPQRDAEADQGDAGGDRERAAEGLRQPASARAETVP